MYPLTGNGIRTIYPSVLNEGFSLRFNVGSQGRPEKPEESRRIYQSKRCEYNNENKENSANIPSDKKKTVKLRLNK